MSNQKTDGVKERKWSKSPLHKHRRESAMKRLYTQLKLNTKLSKDGESIPLTEKDVLRIGKEIGTLKERV